jgi:hypothetical protein
MTLRECKIHIQSRAKCCNDARAIMKFSRFAAAGRRPTFVANSYEAGLELISPNRFQAL